MSDTVRVVVRMELGARGALAEVEVPVEALDLPVRVVVERYILPATAAAIQRLRVREASARDA